MVRSGHALLAVRNTAGAVHVSSLRFNGADSGTTEQGAAGSACSPTPDDEGLHLSMVIWFCKVNTPMEVRFHPE